MNATTPTTPATAGKVTAAAGDQNRPIAVTRDLSKRFVTKWALKRLNVTLPKGEAIGLLGVNGSGKSTLMRILSGVQHPTRGTVEVLGRRPGRETKEHVAYSPEVDAFYPWMRADEAIRFHRAIYADFSEEKARELLTQLALPEDAPVGSLSKGQRARLKLALTLARGASLFILDEPLSGIDPGSRRRILDTIVRDFRPDDSTMLISTHQVREAEALFDRVIFMKQGEVVLHGNADELREDRGCALEDLFAEVCE